MYSCRLDHNHIGSISSFGGLYLSSIDAPIKSMLDACVQVPWANKIEFDVLKGVNFTFLVVCFDF